MMVKGFVEIDEVEGKPLVAVVNEKILEFRIAMHENVVVSKMDLAKELKRSIGSRNTSVN